GGIADGTVDICKGDGDVMILADFITLTDTFDEIVPKEDQLNAMVERNGGQPGYVLIKVLPGNIQALVSYGLEYTVVHVTGKGFYISSTTIIQAIISENEIEHRSGPAIKTYLSENGDILNQIDCVFSIYYSKWPDEAKAWPDRVRQCCWPPGEIVQAIVSSGCHIVPKGSQGGVFSDIEWCISFAMHEKCLIRSFSSVQYHHYILLKRILKHEFLEKYSDIMTSYVAKTICFWQMELNKREMWQTKYFVDRIIKSVLFLRDCISTRYVPHYFIPENNIVHGKVNIKMKAELVKDLSDFASILIDLCNKPERLTQFLFGNDEIIDMWIYWKLSTYYEIATDALCHKENANIRTNLEYYYTQVETIHGSVINAFNILLERNLFNVLHKTLLKCISESELQDEHDQYRSELNLLLQNLSKCGGFSRKVITAEIHFMLGQPDKCIDIITEALTMDTATALKSENDIMNRASDELVGILKRRSVMSLSQFLRTYLITPIMLSEDHIGVLSQILQQDIFETLRDKPIMVDSLPYACFLLTRAFHVLSRTEMAAEAVNTLIFMLEEEPTQLDYKEAAMCLLHYVVNLTSRSGHVVS
ncbi:hypothetical protein ACJMK2_000880, partial [Sinanodonta woodiana]